MTSLDSSPRRLPPSFPPSMLTGTFVPGTKRPHSERSFTGRNCLVTFVLMNCRLLQLSLYCRRFHPLSRSGPHKKIPSSGGGPHGPRRTGFNLSYSWLGQNMSYQDCVPKRHIIANTSELVFNSVSLRCSLTLIWPVFLFS